MSKIEQEVTIKNPQGLHARPAALFVQTASKYMATINVRKGDERVSGKSIMGILMLAAQHGSQLVIEAEGDDAEAAVNELKGFLEKHE